MNGSKTLLKFDSSSLHLESEMGVGSRQPTLPDPPIEESLDDLLSLHDGQLIHTTVDGLFSRVHGLDIPRNGK